MRAERAAGLLLIVASATLLSACDDRDDRRSSNRGPSRSETRKVDSFDSIDMRGAARLEITVGQPESLVIEGRASSIERVETDVRHDTLYIESKPRDWFMSNNRRRITVKITVPELESLEVEGGNDVRLTGFAGGETKIRAAGAAHILAEGHLDELTVRMAGAGHGDFSRLVARRGQSDRGRRRQRDRASEGHAGRDHERRRRDPLHRQPARCEHPHERPGHDRAPRFEGRHGQRGPRRRAGRPEGPAAGIRSAEAEARQRERLRPKSSRPDRPARPALVFAAAHCAPATVPSRPAAPGTTLRRPRTQRRARHPCRAHDCP